MNGIQDDNQEYNQDDDENAIADEKLATSQIKSMQKTVIKQASQHPINNKYDSVGKKSIMEDKMPLYSQ